MAVPFRDASVRLIVLVGRLTSFPRYCTTGRARRVTRWQGPPAIRPAPAGRALTKRAR